MKRRKETTKFVHIVSGWVQNIQKSTYVIYEWPLFLTKVLASNNMETLFSMIWSFRVRFHSDYLIPKLYKCNYCSMT